MKEYRLVWSDTFTRIVTILMETLRFGSWWKHEHYVFGGVLYVRRLWTGAGSAVVSLLTPGCVAFLHISHDNLRIQVIPSDRTEVKIYCILWIEKARKDTVMPFLNQKWNSEMKPQICFQNTFHYHRFLTMLSKFVPILCSKIKMNSQTVKTRSR